MGLTLIVWMMTYEPEQLIYIVFLCVYPWILEVCSGKDLGTSAQPLAWTLCHSRWWGRCLTTVKGNYRILTEISCQLVI